MHNASAVDPALNASGWDNYDYLEEWDGLAHGGTLKYVTMAVLGLVIVVGGFCNLSAIVVLIRLRLWLKNEGYVHLLAILTGNIVIIVIVDFPHWMSLFRHSYHVGLTADAVCKVWHFLACVVFSTGWYVVALLVGVYLRRRPISDLQSRSCRGLADKYCTLTGSKVVVGVISGAFAVINLWQLWSAELIEFNVGGEYFGKFCEITHYWYSIFFVWEHVSLCIIWFLPVLVIVPALLVAVLWARRRGSSAGRGFSFRQMSDNDDEDDESGDAGDLARASLLIGLTLFLLQSPIIVIYIFLTFDYHGKIAVAYGVAHILSTSHLIVVPVLCLASIARMRMELQSAAAAGKCCPGRDGEEDDVNGILQLNSISQLQSSNRIV